MVFLIALPFIVEYSYQSSDFLFFVNLTLFILCLLIYKANYLNSERSLLFDDVGHKVYSYNNPFSNCHCKYQQTLDGFIISYRNQEFDQVIAYNIDYGIGMIASIVLFVPSIVKAFFPSKIEVNTQFVVIEGKQFKREEFDGFVIARTYKSRYRTVAELGYKEGARIVAFGGAWNEKEANFVASTLNKLIGVAQAGFSDERP